MTVRVEVVTPCEHGEGYRHPIQVVLKDHLGPGLDDVGYDWSNMCPGGSRRSFTELPPEAIEAVARGLYETRPEVVSGSWPQWADVRSASRALHISNARNILAAAWATLTGDKK